MSVFHPVTVHFPIALLLVSSACVLFTLRRSGTAWETTAYHCLLIGWFSGVIAIITGSIDAWRQLNVPGGIGDTGLINWVNAHAFTNIAAIAIYGRALLDHRRHRTILSDPERRSSYVRLHVFGALVLLVGGWLGGQLVYEFGLGIAG